MTTLAVPQEALRKRLLQRLAGLSAPAGQYGTVSHGAASGVKVFGYCIRVQERVVRHTFEHPSVVVVLSGTKELWLGEHVQRFPTGAPFVIPAGVPLDLVNIPDPRSGRYESLCITVDTTIRQQLRASLTHVPRRTRLPADLAVPLTADLIDAYAHAASSLIDSDAGVAVAVARHRLIEILLLIGRTQLSGMLATASRVEQVEAVFLADPGHPWRVEDVAGALHLGASTLRRQLKDAGTSFRQILLDVRMATATKLLMAEHSVTHAAQATGYASRSHFARHIRATSGMLPSDLRRMA